MKELRHNITRTIILLSILVLAGCVDVDEYDNSPTGNMEALWNIMDQRYCFFEEKKAALGVDWNDVHSRYQANVNEGMSNAQLFEFLGRMIGELKDGHVNLTTSFDYARNWSWKEDYPLNFSNDLHRILLGKDYRIAVGLEYKILDDNIGYIYCSTFENEIGEGNLDEIMLYLASCQGLIVDVRSNGGGELKQAQKLAARFCDSKTFVGYMRHKTGPGHDDFSDFEEQYIEPTANIRWHKPVCVLTNRSTYSAANEFVKYMKVLPGVTVVGDNTGGGAGMPYSAELPNGWAVRFSACPMFDVNRKSTENGIEPDVKTDIKAEDASKGLDTIVEAARKQLSSTK